MNLPTSQDVVVEPVIAFNHFQLLLGVEEANRRYSLLYDETKELAQCKADSHFSVSGAIESALQLRDAILKESNSRIMPLCVERIDLILRTKKQRDPTPLQALSYFSLPIFISQSVIDSFQFDIKRLRELSINYVKCTLGDERGYFIEKVSGIRKMTLETGNVKTLCNRNILIAYTGTLSRDLHVTASYLYKGITIVHSVKKETVASLVDITEESDFTCVVHACNDFTLIDNVPNGLGVYCCELILKGLRKRDNYLCLTECAVESIRLDASKFKPKTVPTVGVVFIRTAKRKGKMTKSVEDLTSSWESGADEQSTEK